MKIEAPFFDLINSFLFFSLLCKNRGRESKKRNLTVRLLVAGAGTATTELLGLGPTVVGDQQGAVVLDEGLLELVLGVLVDVLLVVGDDGLGDGLTDGVDLGGVTTTGDADADVDTGKLVSADDQEGLVDLFTAEDVMSEKKFSSWLICFPLPFLYPGFSPSLARLFHSLSRQGLIRMGGRR